MFIHTLGDIATVVGQCVLCKGVYRLSVPAKGFARWQDGELIQDALPDVPAEERDVLITCLCRECLK